MFWENFLVECAKKQKTPAGVVEELGISNSMPTSWKKGAIRATGLSHRPETTAKTPYLVFAYTAPYLDRGGRSHIAENLGACDRVLDSANLL